MNLSTSDSYKDGVKDGKAQAESELIDALQEVRDVLFLVQDGKVDVRRTMVQNAIAIADSILNRTR